MGNKDKQTKERYRLRYRKLKKEHRCVNCGRAMEESWEKKQCPVCHEKSKNTYDRLMRYRNENGLCSRCGKASREEGKKSCRACLDIQLDRMWIHRQNLMDAKRCPQCATELPNGYGYVYCDTCRAKDKEKYERQKLKREDRKDGTAYSVTMHLQEQAESV